MFTNKIGTQVGLMKNRVKHRVRNSASALSGAQSNVAHKTRRVLSRTDYAVHENAWKLLGLTAVVGIVGGYLLARRYGSSLPGEVTRSVTDEDGKPREVRFKTFTGFEIFQSLLPFALFLVKARQANKCAQNAQIEIKES